MPTYSQRRGDRSRRQVAGSPTRPVPTRRCTNLDALYSQWNTDKGQPLLANEVARQIWYILDAAIANYYPNVENIVLVGGDYVIPFFRVPDETKISNEGDYYSQLTSAGALNTSAAARTRPTSAAAPSTAIIQTDNYYADRRPTPWRGRGLYLPELAIGRLVETTDDIWHYLKAYDSFWLNWRSVYDRHHEIPRQYPRQHARRRRIRHRLRFREG